MGSVGSVNPGVGDLLQALYNNNASLSPVLSSSAVESAIQAASPVDLVQLSAQALQLQQTSDLFGSYDPASQISGPGATLLQELEADNPSSSGNSTISLLG